MSDIESAKQIDEDLDVDAAEELAFRKLIYGMVPGDTLEMGPVEAAVRVVQEFETLREENERLRERVAELEAEVTPHPESKEYHELTRDEKVHQLRESLVEKASAKQSGKFSMGYKDVMWLFDGHPSPGHTYDLMELAGQADGFGYDTFEDSRPNRIRVKLDAVNDESVFRAANKAPEGVRF